MQIAKIPLVIYLVVIVLTSSGCASFAHNRFACSSVADYTGPMKFWYLFLGNIAQANDCALFKNFRLELGDYYTSREERIDDEVREEKGIKPGWPTEIYDFGRALDCKEDGLKQFNIVLLKNKDEIFGKEFDNSARHVTLTIKKLIQEDDILKKACN